MISSTNVLQVSAQSNGRGYYVKAEKLFKQKKYYEAIQYYEKYLSTEVSTTARSNPFAVQKKIKGKSNLSTHNETVYHLAESYRLCNNYAKAEKWYEESTHFDKDAYPESLYWYGVTLRANQKYDDALAAFTAFREAYTNMDKLLTGADRELENLKFIKQQLAKEKQTFTTTPIRMPGNTSAYAMNYSSDEKVAFTSIKNDSASIIKTSMYTVSLYETSFDGTKIEKIEKINFPEEEGYQNGMATFDAEGRTMFFTKWKVENGKTISSIYKSKKTDTGWTKPLKLGEPVNIEGSNTAQPFITTDDKYLLFASDRAGGIGKFDLWFAPLDSNLNPLLVTNLGNTVNTAEDDLAPSYHQTSRTLLYSSNGLIGMGGFDIYSVKGDFQLSNWDKPKNAGYPINSSKDDLYYISTDEDNLWNTGILSSDRNSECCLDMFAVKQDNKQIIKGMVVDCKSGQPLSGVSLSIKSAKRISRNFVTEETDKNGNYSFSLNNASRFDITAQKEGYEPLEQSYTVYFDSGTDTINNSVICLTMLKHLKDSEVQNAIDELNERATIAKFSYNKSSLDKGIHVELDSLVSLMKNNPDIMIEVGGYTDGKGSEEYNLVLAQKRIDVCIKYLVQKGINQARLTGKAYGECCPLEPETIDGRDNPAARERNRRVEYKLVQ
ncbi:MAG: OmpA family protein [Chitinophagaceae bacterium]|nr:OmpA family protein [Chitinophagaceae bacterium]